MKVRFSHEPSWTAEAESVHSGVIPDCILPGGGADLVFSIGKPLPTPWGDDTMLLSVSRMHSIRLGEVRAEAFRVPLQMGLLGRLDPSILGVEDGSAAPGARLREVLRDPAPKADTTPRWSWRSWRRKSFRWVLR